MWLQTLSPLFSVKLNIFLTAALTPVKVEDVD